MIQGDLERYFELDLWSEFPGGTLNWSLTRILDFQSVSSTHRLSAGGC